MDGLRQVLGLLEADILERYGQLARHLLVDAARNADAAGLRHAFEARRDIDPVSQEVAIALDHVANRQSDPNSICREGA